MTRTMVLLLFEIGKTSRGAGSVGGENQQLSFGHATVEIPFGHLS